MLKFIPGILSTEVLCNKISVALGGVNTFRPFIDTGTNTLKIIDETSLPNRNDVLTSNTIGGKSTNSDPVIQIYGYNYLRDPQNNITQGYAGFVKNFKFTSKLDPKFAQIISIGATAQGGVIGEDATAFTSLNRGLKDRIKPEIFASSGFKVDSKINIEEKSPEDQFKDSLADFESYIGSIGVNSEGTAPTLIEAEIESYTNLYNNIMQYTETKNAVSQKKSSGTMGFIPVSVGLTLDGISGLKLLNGIKVDTSYLPSNYPETMLFVISKLAHKVENNIWTTELETIMTPDNTVQPDTVINGKSRRQTGQSSGNSGGGSSPKPKGNFNGPTPNADRLRAVLTELGYGDKGQISTGGDITPALANYAIAAFKQIKTSLPDLQVRVSGGNDLFHKTLSYVSSHTLGNGLDFTISPATSENKKIIDNILGGFAAGNQEQIVSFINEYDYPSSASTGGHYHIRIGGKIESNRIAGFIKLAKEGKLTTYTIA